MILNEEVICSYSEHPSIWLATKEKWRSWICTKPQGHKGRHNKSRLITEVPLKVIAIQLHVSPGDRIKDAFFSMTDFADKAGLPVAAEIEDRVIIVYPSDTLETFKKRYPLLVEKGLI